MRPRCSPGRGPRGSRSCVRTLEPGSGVDPSFRADRRGLESYPRPQAPPISTALHGDTIPASHGGPPAMPARLPYTGNDEADDLLGADPLALLVGFDLDQQVTVQKAFSGPWQL